VVNDSYETRQQRIQNFGMGGGKVGVGFGEGALPTPQKNLWILSKNYGFCAKFLPFLRCIQSTGGGAPAFPLNPPLKLDCVWPTQSSVIQIIHRNVGLRSFQFYKNVCLLLSLYNIHAYFIHISQGSVETHLRCGGMCNNHIIANCPQSVSVTKNFENRSVIGEDIDKNQVPRFFWFTVYMQT